MSRILGKAVHEAYVFPDFEAALKRFAALGIGPFFTLDIAGGMSKFRGEENWVKTAVAFVYTGDTCFEIMSPIGEQRSTYSEFIERNPQGGLHHIAYFSSDFDQTLADLDASGQPCQVVQEFNDPATGAVIEVYCEPIGVENPVHFQLIRPGLFDAWFDAMREEAANWDGTDPVRDARPLMMKALATLAD